MRCLNPISVTNPRYRKMMPVLTGKGELPDFRIMVPCGCCYACNKTRSQQWRVRLMHEYERFSELGKKCWFVTMTVSDDYYQQDIAVRENPELAVRRFLERYRKKYGVSLRHWFVTELGSKRGRLHFHGLVFDPLCTADEFIELWKYGEPQAQFIGYVSRESVTYITKYMLKPQKIDGEWYKVRVFASPGLGKSYCDSEYARVFHSQGAGLFYILFTSSDGLLYRYPMPRYYREKIFPKLFLEMRRNWLQDNPPPLRLVVGNMVYMDVDSYLAARKWRYEDTLSRGSSRSVYKIDRNLLLECDPLGEFSLDEKKQYKQLKLFKNGTFAESYFTRAQA